MINENNQTPFLIDLINNKVKTANKNKFFKYDSFEIFDKVLNFFECTEVSKTKSLNLEFIL